MVHPLAHYTLKQAMKLWSSEISVAAIDQRLMIRLRTNRTNSSDNRNFCKGMNHNSTTTTHYSYRYGSNNFTTHFLIPEGYNCATTTLDLPLERSYFSQASVSDFCVHKQILSPQNEKEDGKRTS